MLLPSLSVIASPLRAASQYGDRRFRLWDEHLLAFADPHDPVVDRVRRREIDPGQAVKRDKPTQSRKADVALAGLDVRQERRRHLCRTSNVLQRQTELFAFRPQTTAQSLQFVGRHVSPRLPSAHAL
jgi:hypothetical protein